MIDWLSRYDGLQEAKMIEKLEIKTPENPKKKRNQKTSRHSALSSLSVTDSWKASRAASGNSPLFPTVAYSAE